MLTTCWQHAGNRFGNRLTICWQHASNMLATCWQYAGNMLPTRSVLALKNFEMYLTSPQKSLFLSCRGLRPVAKKYYMNMSLLEIINYYKKGGTNFALCQNFFQDDEFNESFCHICCIFFTMQGIWNFTVLVIK